MVLIILDVFPFSRWAVILAFDVKVEREAQEMADAQGVKIFTADIIYHLFDSFMKYREVCLHASAELMCYNFLCV